jgi:hypothetical protein
MAIHFLSASSKCLCVCSLLQLGDSPVQHLHTNGHIQLPVQQHHSGTIPLQQAPPLCNGVDPSPGSPGMVGGGGSQSLGVVILRDYRTGAMQQPPSPLMAHHHRGCVVEVVGDCGTEVDLEEGGVVVSGRGGDNGPTFTLASFKQEPENSF